MLNVKGNRRVAIPLIFVNHTAHLYTTEHVLPPLYWLKQCVGVQVCEYSTLTLHLFLTPCAAILCARARISTLGPAGQADSWCIVIMLFGKIGMLGGVEYEPCVMRVQRTAQEAQQSSTRCLFIAVALPYLLDQRRCCVEGQFGGHAY